MGYRGEDLDLRTPQTWSATPSDLASAAGDAGYGSVRGRRSSQPAPRNGPIWVDDTVLAVFNHAFDVAAAHRSAEVRVEHLLHALTRIDTAAELLEARGIRVAGLRRDSATVIAGELPVAGGSGPHAPRRSNDLADVLRVAAAQAYRRNAPATVEDLLAVLDSRTDLPGMQLIVRHGGHAPREFDAPPPRTPAYVPEPPRYAEPEPPRERVRAPRQTHRQDSYRAADYRTPELLRDQGRGTSTDAFQNARLDTLEQAVRNLGLDLADERSKFAGILQDLQRDLGAQRDDASRHSGGLYDRLQSIEQMVARPRNDDGQDEVLDRLAAIEQGVQARLNELSRSWTGLADRMNSIEETLHETSRLAAQSAALPPPRVDLAPLNDRLAQLERAVRDGLGDSSRHWLGLADKLKSVEQALANPPAPAAVDLTPIGNRLDFIEEALISRDPEPTRELVERLGALEQTHSAARTQSFETTAALGAEIKALAGAVATQAASAERFQAAMGDRLNGVSGQLERSRAEIASVVSGNLGERLTALGQAADRRHAEATRLVDAHRLELANAIQALDRQVGERVQGIAEGQRTEFGGALNALAARTQGIIETQHVEIAAAVQSLVETQRTEIAAAVQSLDQRASERVQRIADTQSLYSRDLAEVHDALVKLNANQHTLAGSIDQWRTDASGDIGVIANRIGSLEREAGKPMQLLSAVAANMDTVHRIEVDRTNRRRRFWYWLFGTDDWLAASWPDQATKVDTARFAAKIRKA